MNKTLFIFLLAFMSISLNTPDKTVRIFITGDSTAQTGLINLSSSKNNKITIHTIGDSTMAPKDTVDNPAVYADPHGAYSVLSPSQKNG